MRECMETEYAMSPGGILVPEQPERVLQAVDLFCGCGGFSLGCEQAGIDVVGAVEKETAPATTYLWNLGSPRGCAIGYAEESDRRRFLKSLDRGRKNRDPLAVYPGDHGWIGFQRISGGGWGGPLGVDAGCRGMMFGDASRITGEDILEVLHAAGWRGEIDVVIGGPPCQGMSMAGRQREDDPRNNLVLEFVRIAGELEAKIFIMENVPPLVTQEKFRPLLRSLIDKAHGYGFGVAATVLDAVNYGVPQYRRRAIIQGLKEGCPAFPMPTNFSLVAPVGEVLRGVVPNGWAPIEPPPALQPRGDQLGLELTEPCANG